MGHRVSYLGNLYTTHWQNPANIVLVECTEGEYIFTIIGHMIKHKSIVSNPFKHFLLRVLAITFGQKIIPFLKNVLIFKQRPTSFNFKRHIRIGNILEIRDFYDPSIPSKCISPAPFYSLRHVASAGGMTPEEMFAENFQEVDEGQGVLSFESKLVNDHEK